jgi:hypothetical protein
MSAVTAGIAGGQASNPEHRVTERHTHGVFHDAGPRIALSTVQPPHRHLGVVEMGLSLDGKRTAPCKTGRHERRCTWLTQKRHPTLTRGVCWPTVQIRVAGDAAQHATRDAERIHLQQPQTVTVPAPPPKQHNAHLFLERRLSPVASKRAPSNNPRRDFTASTAQPPPSPHQCRSTRNTHSGTVAGLLVVLGCHQR